MAMTNLERLNHWVASLANIGILVGLVLVAVELNQNTRQLTLTLRWQVNQRLVENNRDLMAQSTHEVYAKSITHPQDLSFGEFQAVAGLNFNFLNVWEDHYFMYENGLIGDQEWKAFVDDDIGYTLGNRFAQALWQTSKKNYEPELVEYVDDKLAGLSTAATYQWYLDTLNRVADQQDDE